VGCVHTTTLIRIRPTSGSFLVVQVLGLIGVPAAQDLDRRAHEDGVVEPDVRFGDFDAYSLHRGMILQDRGGYPLGNRLGQVHWRPLDYLLRPPVNLAVVDGLRQVVSEACGAQVQAQLHIHDEGLTQLTLGGERAVAAVEDHALEQYPILGIFLAAGHPLQYKGP
jgi:hypothetical protein